MYSILVAHPQGDWPGVPGLNAFMDISNLFGSDEFSCFSSLDPEDVEKCDGVIVPGAPPDVNAEYWGEENLPCVNLDEAYDEKQLRMIRKAYDLHKPIFGICRGEQLISVYNGASLIQDITGTPIHKFDPDEPHFHEVRNVPGTFMYELYGESMKVNSAHHQAVRKVPENFRVSQIWCSDESKYDHYMALAAAGELREGSSEVVIEAVYQINYPFSGLQWHPEQSGFGLECYHIGLDCSPIADYFHNVIKTESKR